MFAANEPRLSLFFLKGLCIYYFLIRIIPMEISAHFLNISQLKPPPPSFMCRAAGIAGARRARHAAAATRHVTVVPSASTRTGKSTTTYVAKLCRLSSKARPPPPSAPLPPPAVAPAAPRTHRPPLPLARPRPARPPP